MADESVERVASWLRSASAVVALTGAGISTDSGIPDLLPGRSNRRLEPEVAMATTKKDLADSRVQGHPLSIDQARALLGVSLATIYRYMAKLSLSFNKQGRTRVIDERDLLNWKLNHMFTTDGERARMQRRAAAHALHSLYDSRELTKPARDAFFRRFERAVDPLGLLTARERERRATQAKKAYFTDLARRSSKARQRREA